MLEQKKLPILEALAAFGIGGIFTAACMAGLAYLMANQSLAQSLLGVVHRIITSNVALVAIESQLDQIRINSHGINLL